MWIDDWRRAWRYLSVQVAGIAAALWAAWLATPAEHQQQLMSLIGLDLNRWGPLIAFAAFVAARLKAQPKLHGGRNA